MRTILLILALAAVLALGQVSTAAADSGSISRDARGPQPAGTHDSLGGPPTPRVFGLGQPLILASGVVLLAAAAALGAYTLILGRRPAERR
jgi:hypothetical protein